jgi:hypothetical protein
LPGASTLMGPFWTRDSNFRVLLPLAKHEVVCVCCLTHVPNLCHALPVIVAVDWPGSPALSLFAADISHLRLISLLRLLTGLCLGLTKSQSSSRSLLVARPRSCRLLVESRNVFRMLVNPWAGVRKFVQMTQLSDGRNAPLNLCAFAFEVLFHLGRHVSRQKLQSLLTLYFERGHRVAR